LRRDELANTPVSVYFARLLGVGQFSVSAVSAAYRGYPAEVTQVIVDLPIAIKEAALTNGPPDRDNYLRFHSEGEKSTKGTTFFTTPSNDATVDNYGCGCLTTPVLTVGNLSTGTWNHLREESNQHKSGCHWQVILQVVSEGGNSTTVNVVGFTASLSSLRSAAHLTRT
jgi:hypothetical protein